MVEPVEDDRCPNCGLPITADGPCPRCGMEVSIYRGPPVPVPPRQTDPPSPRSRLYMWLNVLVLVLGAFWLGLTVVMCLAVLNGGLGGGVLFGFFAGIANLVVATYHFYVAVAVYRRSYRVQGQLVLASAVGIGLGVFIAILFGWWPPLLATPFHLAVSGFAVFGGRHFELYARRSAR